MAWGSGSVVLYRGFVGARAPETRLDVGNNIPLESGGAYRGVQDPAITLHFLLRHTAALKPIQRDGSQPVGSTGGPRNGARIPRDIKGAVVLTARTHCNSFTNHIHIYVYSGHVST